MPWFMSSPKKAKKTSYKKLGLSKKAQRKAKKIRKSNRRKSWF